MRGGDGLFEPWVSLPWIAGRAWRSRGSAALRSWPRRRRS